MQPMMQTIAVLLACAVREGSGRRVYVSPVAVKHNETQAFEMVHTASNSRSLAELIDSKSQRGAKGTSVHVQALPMIFSTLQPTAAFNFPGPGLHQPLSIDTAASLSRQRRSAGPQLLNALDKPPLSWIAVEDGPEKEPSPGASVMPVFPLHTLQWPGQKVNLNIMEPCYRRMYDDILLSGARRFLMTWSPYLRPFPPYHLQEAPKEARRLHAVGMVVYLEDLQEVSEETNDIVKYKVQHSVVGRARMTRILNPSALYRSNAAGMKVDYLRAEVELYDNADIESDRRIPVTLAEELIEAWEDMADVAESLGEPRPVGGEMMQRQIVKNPSWELVSFWSNYQLALLKHREEARVYAMVKNWMEEQQQQGLMPSSTQVLDGSKLPRSLQQALMKSQHLETLDADDDFWEPLLRMQCAETPTARAQLLLDGARQETSLMRARASMRAFVNDE